MSRRIAARLIHFVRQQSAAACQAEQLIGSSECIESLIGKGKRLEGQQSKSGFTKMVLAMAAAVAKPTKDYIPRALAAVTTADVLAWCRAPLGCFGAIPTPPSLRRNRNRNGINKPRSLPLILRSPPQPSPIKGEGAMAAAEGGSISSLSSYLKPFFRTCWRRSAFHRPGCIAGGAFRDRWRC